MKFKYMCFASEKYRKTGNCHYSLQAFYIIKMFTYLRAVVFDVLQINFCSGWLYGLINVINGTKLYMCPNYSKEKKEIKKNTFSQIVIYYVILLYPTCNLYD